MSLHPLALALRFKRRLLNQPLPTAAWINRDTLADLYTGITVYHVESYLSRWQLGGRMFYLQRGYTEFAQAVTHANLLARAHGYELRNERPPDGNADGVSRPANLEEMLVRLVVAALVPRPPSAKGKG